MTIAVVPGVVIGVAQDSGSVAWLESTVSGCRLHVRALAGKTDQTVPATCLPSGQELVLAGGRAAWGGYVDVRCSETTADVYTTDNSRSRLVEEIPGDCLGYRTAFQGLVSDGTSFFYSLLVTNPPSSTSNCGNGGPCQWRLGSGRIVRITGSRPATVRGLPPAALIAADDGRVALVAPAASASSNGRSANAFDWPRAAEGGRVEIRSTSTNAIVTSFHPSGIVRAVALSAGRTVVLVEAHGRFEIEWFDSGSGARVGAATVLRGTAPSLSTDGRFVGFSVGTTVRVLDLETGVQRIITRGASDPIGLSVQAGRLVWGENSGTTGRILTALA